MQDSIHGFERQARRSSAEGYSINWRPGRRWTLALGADAKARLPLIFGGISALARTFKIVSAELKPCTAAIGNVRSESSGC